MTTTHTTIDHQNQKRDINIDIMKAIGIFLVVFAHVYQDAGAIYLFHMPMFFMLSGAAMNYSRKAYSLTHRFKTIMVPYFAFSILCFIYWYFIESKFRPIHSYPPPIFR